MSNLDTLEFIFENTELDQFVHYLDVEIDPVCAMHCLSIIQVFASSPYTLREVLQRFDPILPLTKKILQETRVSINKKLDAFMLLNLFMLTSEYRPRVIGFGIDEVLLAFFKTRREENYEQVEEVILLNIVQFFIYFFQEEYLALYNKKEEQTIMRHSVNKGNLIQELVLVLEEVLLSPFSFQALTSSVLTLIEHFCYSKENLEKVYNLNGLFSVKTCIEKMVGFDDGKGLIEKSLWVLAHFAHLEKVWNMMICKEIVVQVFNILVSGEEHLRKIAYSLLWDLSFSPGLAKLIVELPHTENLMRIVDAYLEDRESFRPIIVNLSQDLKFKSDFKALIPLSKVFSKENVNPELYDQIMLDIETSKTHFSPIEITPTTDSLDAFELFENARNGNTPRFQKKILHQQRNRQSELPRRLPRQ